MNRNRHRVPIIFLADFLVVFLLFSRSFSWARSCHEPPIGMAHWTGGDLVA
jgi:hypothetical protein